MKIYDESKINQNDPLREIKKNKLRSIEGYVSGIIAFPDEQIGDNYLRRPYNHIEALEKNLWDVIGRYGLAHQREDAELRNLSARYPYFREVWHEKLINSTDNQEIKDIYNVVIRAIVKYSGFLTREIKQTWKESAECWPKNHDSYCNIKGFHTCKESSEMLREKLAKFDAKFPFSVNNGDWAKEWARKVLRDCLLTEIEQADKWESKEDRRDDNANVIDDHDRKFKVILDNLQNAKFFQNKKGKWKVEAAGQEIEHTITSFRDWMGQLINSEYLREKWLPLRQKKADLLRKVEEVIANGIKEVERDENASQSTSTTSDADKVNETTTTTSDSETSGDTIDDDTEVNSIFDEDQAEDSDSDNSSVNSSFSDNNEKPTENSDSSSKKASIIRKEKDRAFFRIENSLNREPVVKEEELEEENRGWLKKIEEATSVKEIYSIETKINLDIRNKRNLKKKTAELDDILEETVDSRNFDNHFQTVQRSLGETGLQVKAERAKKKLIENDPELYFDTFNNWVRKEEEALELEAKNKELAAELEAISEIKYNEEEKQFLAGEITDQQKQEEIAQRIEEKINVKKKTWSLWKWIKEQTAWIKSKAKLLKKNNKVGFEKKVEQIKQEIKNVENSSNLHTQQAFKHTKNKAQALLRELENVVNENTNNTTDKSKFPTGWVVGIGVLIAVPALVAGIIIRQRRMKVRRKGQK